MDRQILHVDQNCFFASVEMKDHPELRNVPMAVGGDQEKRHGIILAKNQLAGKYGIKTAETIWQARQKCPDLVVVSGHYEKYTYYSQKLFSLFCQYTDRVESFGLDECWLDVTDHLGGTDHKAKADEIRARVRDELGLTCSVGASYNKVFAKLGSDYKKPDATTYITRDNFKDMLWKLPVGDLLFAGRATQQKLAKINIHTIGQLASMEREYLQQYLGKNGDSLWISANGLDESPVELATYHRTVKSVGNSTTTARDMICEDDIWKTILALSDQVAGRLRKYGLMGTTIQIHIRDTDLLVYERQQRLPEPCDQQAEIARVAMDLFRRTHTWRRPVRSLGVRAADVVPVTANRQISLFDPNDQTNRKKDVSAVIDNLRLRFGKDIIMLASQQARSDDLLLDGQIDWNGGGFSAFQKSIEED